MNKGWPQSSMGTPTNLYLLMDTDLTMSLKFSPSIFNSKFHILSLVILFILVVIKVYSNVVFRDKVYV